MNGDKSTSQTEPWGGIQPYLGAGFHEASEIRRIPRTFYPGQTYADFAPETEAALAGMTQRATGGSPLVDMAQGRSYGMMGAPGTEALTRTALGEYTGQDNPYLDQVAESVRSRVLPGVQSSFGMAGRTGDSPIAQGVMAREMTNALAPYQFQQYGQERQLQEGAARQLASNQLSAMGMAPSLADIDYQDLARLGQVGAVRQAQEERGIQEDMARHEFEQNERFNRLAQYMQLLGQTSPLVGGAGTTTARQQQNPLMTLLGLGATAAGAYYGG